MLKALGLRGAAPSKPASETEALQSCLKVVDNALSLELALRAMDLVMDDRPQDAQKLLDGNSSTYKKLAQGIVHFIEATLGLEPEYIRRAVESLAEAEQSSHKNRNHAQKAGIISSSKFPPGTEFALTYAESQLMGAIALFLSESVLDSAKALLKLRKAYQALDELNKYLHDSTVYTNARRTPSNSTLVTLSSLKQNGDEVHANIETKISGAAANTNSTGADNASAGSGGTASSAKTSSLLDKINQTTDEYYAARIQRLKLTHNYSPETLRGDADESRPGEVPGHETVDEFIESGVNCMFGILQLVLSIIPPTIGKVLSVVGFKGDRDEGLRQLWEASKHVNIHGAIALLALLQYFDGPTQFSDLRFPDIEDKIATQLEKLNSSDDKEVHKILSNLTMADDKDPDAVKDSKHALMLKNALEFEKDIAETREKLKNGLETTRKHYSTGALWQLQEGRMVSSSTGDLRRAVSIMDDRSAGEIQLKQVDGLMLFDKTILLMVLHEYETAAVNFERMLDLSTWSHGLYVYFSGSCQLEIYRNNVGVNDEVAASAKKKAKEYFTKIPLMMGKKKFMARTMPFDTFVLRKYNYWVQQSTKHGLDLVDAIGTSPLHEAIYFWNGYARMPREQLEECLSSLGYSGEPGTAFATDNKPPLDETPGERAVRCLFTSMVLRNLGRIEEGKELLEKETLNKVIAPISFSGKSALPKIQPLNIVHEGWCGPSALYERAVFEWRLKGLDGLQRTKDYLDLANNWPTEYELSTRISMKVKSARDRLDAFKEHAK